MKAGPCNPLVWAAGILLSTVIVGSVGAEVPLTDLAQGPNALATQSSICNDGTPDLAIDGNASGKLSEGSMAVTCNEPGEYPWWMVELDSATDILQEVQQITIHNRQDGYLSSLSYSYVEVLDSNQNPVFSQKLPPNSKDASWTIDVIPTNVLGVQLNTPVIGKYVRVRKTVYGQLIMAEVEVLGRPATMEPQMGLATNIARSSKAFAFQSTTCYGGLASHAIDGNTYGNFGTNKGSMASTCSTESATEFSWWMVDLDTITNIEQVIKEITVHNRIDGYLSSLSYSFVEVLDSYMNTVFSQKLPVNTKDPSWKFEFGPPVVGRFVRVRMYNKHQPIIMAEVEVIGYSIDDMTAEPTLEPTPSPTRSPTFAPLTPTKSPSATPSFSPTEPVWTNIALLGHATQSSTCFGGEASRGIDGNTDHSVGTNTCENEPDEQWWMVDLDNAEAGVDQEINQVTIFNRNAYITQLSHAQVQVYDRDMNMVAFKDFPKHFRDLVYTWDFAPAVVGRYVKVQMKALGPLRFAEIEIMGHSHTGITVTPPTIPSASCPPPFDRPEGLQPDAQVTLSVALQTLQDHVVAGPSNPLLNQTEIMAATGDFLATSHQLTATYDLMEAALSLVEAYEGVGGYGLPVSYGPPVFDSRQFSRDRGALDGRELDRSMMLIQQVVLDEMYHANLWGENGVPRTASSDMIDWSYQPVIKECQELFRGRKWWAAKYIPGLVDPPADPTVVHTELVKADYPPNWGRPTSFSNLRRAAYPIGGLYLAPGGVAAVAVPQELVDLGGYAIQIGSQMVDCSRNGHNRQERMTTSFPVDETTTYVANPFGGELYIRAPYGSLIPSAELAVTGDVVQGASFFYSSLRNTTEEEWNDLRANAPAPWIHVVTDPFLRQWYAEGVKDLSYSFMLERAQRYTTAFNAASLSHGIPPEKRNTWVLFDALSSNRCGRASVGTVGYPQANSRVMGSVDGPVLGHFDFDSQDPVIGFGICCGLSEAPHAHDPAGTEITHDITLWHEFGHTAMHRYALYGGGEGESLPHMSYFTSRLALEVENDKSSVDPTGIDTAFMFSCCRIQNPYTFAPRYTIDRQAIEWMTRDNFRMGLPMASEEIRYQHRGHAKYADIARLTGGVEYFNEFMIEEHERWESEGLGEGLGNGGDYWWRASDMSWFPELDDTSASARTLRFSIKAGQDLTPLLQYWGVPHANYTLLKQMMVERNLYPSEDVKNLLLKYKSLIPQNSSSLEASFRDVWVPEITKKNFDDWQEIADAWNSTMVGQAEAMVDSIIELHWPSSVARKLGAPTNRKGENLRKQSPSTVPIGMAESRNLVANAFDEALDTWVSQGPALEYEFIFERDYFGPEELHGPFKVTVKNGLVADAVYAREPNQEVVPDEIDLTKVPTIEGLFDFIFASMDKPGHKVHVRYDDTLGHPVVIHVENDGDDGEEDDTVDDLEWITIYVSSVSIISGEEDA